jgi:hypothetical protein
VGRGVTGSSLSPVPSGPFGEEAIPHAALALGYAGLLPFFALGAAPWFAAPPLAATLAQAQTLYGGVILAFLGGTHWGLAARDGTSLALRLSWSVLAPLFAFAALLLLPPGASQGMLVVGIAGLHLSERRALRRGWMPSWYFRLRRRLTVAAALALVLGALAVQPF